MYFLLSNISSERRPCEARATWCVMGAGGGDGGSGAYRRWPSSRPHHGAGDAPSAGKQGRARGRAHRDSILERMTVEPAHSHWEDPNKQGGLPGCFVEAIWVLSVFPPSACVCLEVLSHTSHLDAAHRPHFVLWASVEHFLIL